MLLKSLVLLCLFALASSQPSYLTSVSTNTFVGAAGDQAVSNACRCPVSVSATGGRKEFRRCGDNCFASAASTCFEGKVKTADTTSSAAVVCTGTTGVERCGELNACRRVTSAGQMFNMPNPVCYSPSTQKCFAGVTAISGSETTGDLVCPTTSGNRCGWYCHTRSADSRCVLGDNTVASADTADDSAIFCPKDTTRCGRHCITSGGGGTMKCWPAGATAGVTTDDASASIACQDKFFPCHSGTYRPETCFANGLQGPGGRDRVCYDPTATAATAMARCFVGDVLQTGNASVMSGDTWVCGPKELRCGFNCYPEASAQPTTGDKTRCVGTFGEDSGTASHTEGVVCAPSTKLCGNTPYDPNTMYCWDGARKTVDVASGAQYLCANDVADADVGPCSCTPITGCVTAGETDCCLVNAGKK